MKWLGLFWLLFFGLSASATTYYVDCQNTLGTSADANNGTAKTTAWIHHPRMTGFTGSYTHAAGDVFIFRGGTTCPSSYLPLALTNSGSSGNVDTYTTDHTWFQGGSYIQPIFDGGNACSSSHMLSATALSFFTVNDIDFTNFCTTGAADSGRMIYIQDSHDFSITNTTQTCYCELSMYFPFLTAGSYSNFTITGNNFSHTSSALWFASAQANTSMHNLTYNSNIFHDFTSQLGGGVHGDGALHYFAAPASDNTQYLDTVIFCDNQFYGDFRVSFAGGGGTTAFFFTEGSFGGTICNNDMSYSPAAASIFDALIDLSGNGNAKTATVGIYNNSLAATNVGVHGFTNIGFDLENQFQNSGPWNLSAISAGSGCSASTLLAVIRGNGQPFAGLYKVSTSKGACATNPTVGIDDETNNVLIQSPDLGGGVTGILIGGNVTCPIACAILPRVTSGTELDDITIEAGVGTTGISISNALGTPGDTTIRNVTNATTNALIDSANSCTDTTNRLGFYVITHAGKIGYSSSNVSGCTDPSILSIPTGTATFAAGSGVTSVVCASGFSCNNTRGTLTIVGGTATTGTIATVSFSATLSAAPACFASENGGSTNFGIGNSAPTTTAFNITSAISVLGVTFNVNYQCQP